MADNTVNWPGWEIGKLIGKGGFGSVYEIYRNEYGIMEKAALKVISIPQSEDEIELMRGEGWDEESITTQFSAQVNDIVREYKMMISLKSCPNVVHVDDYMVVKFEKGLGWNIHLKMELLTPLLKVLDQVNTEQEIIKLGRDLCNALVFCQKKAILHRDIKPQNIFVDEEGNFKLGDFGVAKTAERTTRATVGVGTYSFMAPEVLNNQPYGPTADIYSLGLVLYWLLNKRRGPFLPLPPENYTPSLDEEAKRRRFGGEPLPVPVTGSVELQRIVLKACSFEPKDRYSNALEMKKDLDALSGDNSSVDQTVYDDTRLRSTISGEKYHHGTDAASAQAFEKNTGNIWYKDVAAGPEKKDLDIYETMTFEHKNNPAGKSLSIQVCGKEVCFSVPVNVEDGQIIHVQGKGKYDSSTGRKGDLYITIRIKPAPQSCFPIMKVIIGIAAAFAIILACVLFGFGGRNTGNTQAKVEKTAFSSTPTVADTHTHSWENATCTMAKTCTICGKTIGSVPGHQWNEATYNAPKTCIVCGATNGSKKTPPSSLDLRDIISGVSASSTYSGDNLGTHSPEKMYDGKLDTNWTENATGNGVGEYVTFYFDGTYAVNRLRIYIGSHYNEGVYKQNCRPKVITLTFSDGSTERIQLEDIYDVQTITFGQYYYTDYIKLTIEDVYTGTKYLDTVIAELDFAAYKP